MKYQIICSILIISIFFPFKNCHAVQPKHEDFARKIAEFLLTRDNLSKLKTNEDFFSFARAEGIEPEGGFQEGKAMDMEEAVQLFGRIISKDESDMKIKNSTFALKYKNRVTILKLKGSVKIKKSPNEEWTDAKLNVPLSESALIQTGEDSWAQLKIGMLGHGLLKENSILDLAELKAFGDEEEIHLHLEKGKLLINVQGMSQDSDLKASTPFTLVSVRGTIYEILAD